MTIEERAKESVTWDCDNEEFDISVAQYIKGATEQKAIDIEKACECYCKNFCKGYRDTGRCFVDGRCENYRNFKKSLEE